MKFCKACKKKLACLTKRGYSCIIKIRVYNDKDYQHLLKVLYKEGFKGNSFKGNTYIPDILYFVMVVKINLRKKTFDYDIDLNTLNYRPKNFLTFKKYF